MNSPPVVGSTIDDEPLDYDPIATGRLAPRELSQAGCFRVATRKAMTNSFSKRRQISGDIRGIMNGDSADKDANS
jgi:hypothetical protein